METIGVRELRQHASRWLARVEAGESFEITDRGRPVATLAPVVRSGWDQLVGSGGVSPAVGSLAAVEPLPPRAGRSLSELIAADRADEG